MTQPTKIDDLQEPTTTIKSHDAASRSTLLSDNVGEQAPTPTVHLQSLKLLRLRICAALRLRRIRPDIADELF